MPFFLSNPLYNREQSMTMDDAMRLIGADYVLADRIIEPVMQAPLGPGVETQIELFYRYLRTHCAAFGEPKLDPSYGPFTLYRCLPS